MKVEVSRMIDAPPERVWDLITDAALLQSGNLGILKIEGRIEPGGRLKLWSEVSPKRAFALKVSTFDRPRRMVWSGGMPFGLFKGERTFDIEAEGAGSVLNVREEFSGPLSGMITKSIPDLNPSFNKFADGIKRQAEGAVA